MIPHFHFSLSEHGGLLYFQSPYKQSILFFLSCRNRFGSQKNTIQCGNTPLGGQRLCLHLRAIDNLVGKSQRRIKADRSTVEGKAILSHLLWLGITDQAERYFTVPVKCKRIGNRHHAIRKLCHATVTSKPASEGYAVDSSIESSPVCASYSTSVAQKSSPFFCVTPQKVGRL